MTPTPRAVYDWLAPIREKCPEAWPKSLRPFGDYGYMVESQSRVVFALPPEVAHDLITLHMLRWLSESRGETVFLKMSLAQVAHMVAKHLGLALAPWPGGE